MRLASILSSLWLASLATGCLSGQTGSPDCVGHSSCVCDALYGAGTLLRVHAERHEAGKLEAVVDEVFLSPLYPNDIMVGERVGGSLLAERPRAPQGEPGALAGRELFVLYAAGHAARYPICPAFQSCVAADCGRLEGQAREDCFTACWESSEAACAEQRQVALLDGVFSWALPWSDPLDFGGATALPRSDIAVLASPESCLQRFPPPPAPLCRDTITNGCSAATRRPRDLGWAYVLPLGVLALVHGLRRRHAGR